MTPLLSSAPQGLIAPAVADGARGQGQQHPGICNAAYLYIVAADSQQQPCRRAHGAEGQQTPPAAAIQPVEPGHLFLRRQVHGNDLCRLGRPQLPQGPLLQHQHRLAADGVPEGIPGVVQGPQPQPPAL